MQLVHRSLGERGAGLSEGWDERAKRSGFAVRAQYKKLTHSLGREAKAKSEKNRARVEGKSVEHEQSNTIVK